MTIKLAGKPEMPGAVHPILSPFHAAQSKSANECLFLCPLNFSQKLLYFFGVYFIVTAFQFYMVSEIVDKGSQL